MSSAGKISLIELVIKACFARNNSVESSDKSLTMYLEWVIPTADKIFFVNLQEHRNDGFGPSQDPSPGKASNLTLVLNHLGRNSEVCPDIHYEQDPKPLFRSYTWFPYHIPNIQPPTPAHALSLSHLTLVHEMQSHFNLQY
jgi:hypothetical protein